MCILAVCVNAHPDLPFVCIHNRDEDLSRPTLPPDPKVQTEVIHGHDAKYPDSTWMGLNLKKGYVACINNYRHKGYTDPDPEVRASRGKLVQKFLREPPSYHPGDQDERRPADLEGQYPGFSCVHSDLSTLPVRAFLTSNRPHPHLNIPYHAGEAAWGVIPDGCHAMSNGSFDDVSWPKVGFLRDQVEGIVRSWAPLPDQCGLEEEEEQVRRLVEALMVPLSRTEPFDTAAFPDHTAYSPLPRDKEHANQRVFIAHDHGKALPPLEQSGTRSQTIVVRARRRTYFFFRSTDDYPVVGPWVVASGDVVPDGGSAL